MKWSRKTGDRSERYWLAYALDGAADLVEAGATYLHSFLIYGVRPLLLDHPDINGSIRQTVMSGLSGHLRDLGWIEYHGSGTFPRRTRNAGPENIWRVMPSFDSSALREVTKALRARCDEPGSYPRQPDLPFDGEAEVIR